MLPVLSACTCNTRSPKRILTRGAFSSVLSTMSPMRSDRRSDSSSDSIRSRGHLMPASYCAL